MVYMQIMGNQRTKLYLLNGLLKIVKHFHGMWIRKIIVLSQIVYMI